MMQMLGTVSEVIFTELLLLAIKCLRWYCVTGVVEDSSVPPALLIRCLCQLCR